MRPSRFLFTPYFLFILFFAIADTVFAISNLTSDTSERIQSSFNNIIQTLGTDLEGTLIQIDIQTSNPSALLYGSRPFVQIYECADETYGGGITGITCSVIYSGVSDIASQIGTSTQSLFLPTSPAVVFNPAKYYFFRTQGNNQFNALPFYYGSATSTTDGACYQYRQTGNTTLPCSTVFDLYFNLYGISEFVPPAPPPPPVPPPAPTHSSVLFLPGFEASRLYKARIISCSIDCEDRLWEPNGNSDAQALFMNTDGTSSDDSIYTRDVLDEAYGVLNIYKSFLSKLADMKTDGDIADYSAVPYDWRLPFDVILSSGNKDIDGNISYLTATSSPYILEELRRLVANSQNGKVTIVTHSNGGLLAKTLLKQLADTNDPLLSAVDKLILVAVPQLGTPSAITGLLHGYEQGIPFTVGPFLSSTVARQFGQNVPGAYNFLPSQTYFEQVETPVVMFDDSMSEWISRYGTTTDSVSALQNFLTDSYDRVDGASSDTDTPTALRANLLSEAEATHTILDLWTPPSSLEIVEIAGWGIPTTVSGVKYSMADGEIELHPTFTIDGDGTVVTPSALWGNGYASTMRYWVDLKAYNNASWFKFLGILPTKHKDIFEVLELVNFLENTFTNSTTTPPQYIFDSVPNTSGNRLIYSLHSPLTLDIYDSLGNHTGISTTTGQIEEQIPGTYFLQFGEVKYIFTDTGTPVTVSMSGYDTGTFTFAIQQFQGDTTVSTVTFQNIPTTPTTKVSMIVGNDITSLSPLDVDSDNNGTSDITLTPVINDVVTYTPIPPAPIAPPLSPVSTGGGNGPIMQNTIIPVNIILLEADLSKSLLSNGTTTHIIEKKAQSHSVLRSTTGIKSNPKPKPQIIMETKTVEQVAQAISANPSYISRFTTRVTSFFKKAVNWSLSIFKIN